MESSYYSSDDYFFQSADFFLFLNGIYFMGIGLVHLTHWIINLIVEYKNTRSCGASERHEGIIGYILLGISFSIPFAAVMWITFGDIPDWSYIHFGTGSYCCTWYIAIAWFGTVLAVLDVIAFGYVHYSLGVSWSGTVTVKKDHELVTTGSYRFARHPMYAVLLMAPIITLIQTSNWAYALAWAIGFIYPVSRCRKEERLMQEVFGDQYRDYMDRVGPFCPIVVPFWGNKTDSDGYGSLNSDDNDSFI